MNIYEKLMNIQNELKSPKGQYNSFGKYKYRSCEDILEAVKPICKKYSTTLVLTDEMQNIGERYYIKSNAILFDIENGESVINSAFAREEETKKGMDGSQITGTASSYARKYALNGLFNIDDTKDADTDEYTMKQIENNIIDKTKVEALRTSIQKNNIPENMVELVIMQYGYKKIEDIKMKDYISIVNDFKTKIKE